MNGQVDEPKKHNTRSFPANSSSSTPTQVPLGVSRDLPPGKTRANSDSSLLEDTRKPPPLQLSGSIHTPRKALSSSPQSPHPPSVVGQASRYISGVLAKRERSGGLHAVPLANGRHTVSTDVSIEQEMHSRTDETECKVDPVITATATKNKNGATLGDSNSVDLDNQQSFLADVFSGFSEVTENSRESVDGGAISRQSTLSSSSSFTFESFEQLKSPRTPNSSTTPPPQSFASGLKFIDTDSQPSPVQLDFKEPTVIRGHMQKTNVVYASHDNSDTIVTRIPSSGFFDPSQTQSQADFINGPPLGLQDIHSVGIAPVEKKVEADGGSDKGKGRENRKSRHSKSPLRHLKRSLADKIVEEDEAGLGNGQDEVPRDSRRGNDKKEKKNLAKKRSISTSSTAEKLPEQMKSGPREKKISSSLRKPSFFLSPKHQKVSRSFREDSHTREKSLSPDCGGLSKFSMPNLASPSPSPGLSREVTPESGASDSSTSSGKRKRTSLRNIMRSLVGGGGGSKDEAAKSSKSAKGGIDNPVVLKTYKIFEDELPSLPPNDVPVDIEIKMRDSANTKTEDAKRTSNSNPHEEHYQERCVDGPPSDTTVDKPHEEHYQERCVDGPPSDTTVDKPHEEHYQERCVDGPPSDTTVDKVAISSVNKSDHSSNSKHTTITAGNSESTLNSQSGDFSMSSLTDEQEVANHPGKTRKKDDVVSSKTGKVTGKKTLLSSRGKKASTSASKVVGSKTNPVSTRTPYLPSPYAPKKTSITSDRFSPRSSPRSSTRSTGSSTTSGSRTPKSSISRTSPIPNSTLSPKGTSPIPNSTLSPKGTSPASSRKKISSTGRESPKVSNVSPRSSPRSSPLSSKKSNSTSSTKDLGKATTGKTPSSLNRSSPKPSPVSSPRKIVVKTTCTPRESPTSSPNEVRKTLQSTTSPPKASPLLTRKISGSKTSIDSTVSKSSSKKTLSSSGGSSPLSVSPRSSGRKPAAPRLSKVSLDSSKQSDAPSKSPSFSRFSKARQPIKLRSPDQSKVPSPLPKREEKDKQLTLSLSKASSALSAQLSPNTLRKRRLGVSATHSPLASPLDAPKNFVLDVPNSSLASESPIMNLNVDSLLAGVEQKLSVMVKSQSGTDQDADSETPIPKSSHQRESPSPPESFETPESSPLMALKSKDKEETMKGPNNKQSGTTKGSSKVNAKNKDHLKTIEENKTQKISPLLNKKKSEPPSLSSSAASKKSFTASRPPKPPPVKMNSEPHLSTKKTSTTEKPSVSATGMNRPRLMIATDPLSAPSSQTNFTKKTSKVSDTSASSSSTTSLTSGAKMLKSKSGSEVMGKGASQTLNRGTNLSRSTRIRKSSHIRPGSANTTPRRISVATPASSTQHSSTSTLSRPSSGQPSTRKSIRRMSSGELLTKKIRPGSSSTLTREKRPSVAASSGLGVGSTGSVYASMRRPKSSSVLRPSVTGTGPGLTRSSATMSMRLPRSSIGQRTSTLRRSSKGAPPSTVITEPPLSPSRSSTLKRVSNSGTLRKTSSPGEVLSAFDHISAQASV